MKISALPVLTTPAKEDAIAIVDDSASTTKRMTLATMLNIVYPIGSVYINATDATNPATLLGFGTWVAYSPGRTLVGKAGSGTFATAGSEMGAETHTLSWGQMPSHNHGVNDPGHSHSSNKRFIQDVGGGGNIGQTPGGSVWRNLADLAINGSGTGISIQSAGGNEAHNNIQPSKVAYMWERTA